MDQHPSNTPSATSATSASRAPVYSEPADAASSDVATAGSATVAAKPAGSAPLSSAVAPPMDFAPRISGSKPGTSNRAVIITLSCLTILLVACVFGLVYWISSSVTGTELNVVSWQTRRFSYLRDPFTHRQLTGIEHDTGGVTIDTAILAHLQGGSVGAAGGRWDLVEISHGPDSKHGDAHILTEYLVAGNTSGKSYWTEWTDQHPTAAPILWAAVRDAAQLKRYDVLPDIFETARTETSPENLKLALENVMFPICLNTTRDRLAAGDQAGAQRAAKLGLRYGDSDELRGIAPQE